MNLSGTLNDWSVGDLLSMLQVTKKTATLHVRGTRIGSIEFSAGKVVGASLTSESPVSGEPGSRTAAADALFVLSRLTEGTFEIGPFQGETGEGWDVDSLLSDLDRLKGLEGDLSQSGLGEATLRLRDDIAESVTIQPDDWWAVASLVSVLSFEQLETVFGSGRAIRLLHTLWRMDLVEVLVPEQTETETETETAPPSAVDSKTEIEIVTDTSKSDEESWLDEIAAAADAEAPEVEPVDVETRRLTGVAAPASTVLTGSVLDEMRRLRGRTGE